MTGAVLKVHSDAPLAWHKNAVPARRSGNPIGHELHLSERGAGWGASRSKRRYVRCSSEIPALGGKVPAFAVQGFVPTVERSLMHVDVPTLERGYLADTGRERQGAEQGSAL